MPSWCRRCCSRPRPTLPDIIYIDNSDVAQLADGGYIASARRCRHLDRRVRAGAAALGNYKGNDYAVPSANNTIALYYSTDMFTAAGLEPPKTWDELRETAKKLTKDETYGLVFPGINNEQGAFHTSTFVWSNGGSFEKLNSPEVVGALTYSKSLVEDGSVSKSVVTWAIDDARDQFVSGRAAMMIGGSWLLPQLDEHPDLKYGVVPIRPRRRASRSRCRSAASSGSFRSRPTRRPRRRSWTACRARTSCSNTPRSATTSRRCRR